MKISFIFAWYDFWIGAFFDRKKDWLYIFPFPMFGIILKLPQRRYWLVSNRDPEIVIGSTTKGLLDYCMKQDEVHGRAYLAVNGELRPWFGTDHCDDVFFDHDFDNWVW